MLCVCLERQAEVKFLGTFSHPNVVELFGYCWENKEFLLVYEYMQKGSLDMHLFREGLAPLSWDTRIKIAMGAAQGLAVLHNTENNVICRDVKSSNILLDKDLNPKLSDFGLAKLGPVDGRSHVSTGIAGTYGYMAPEYVATGHCFNIWVIFIAVGTMGSPKLTTSYFQSLTCLQLAKFLYDNSRSELAETVQNERNGSTLKRLIHYSISAPQVSNTYLNHHIAVLVLFRAPLLVSSSAIGILWVPLKEEWLELKLGLHEVVPSVAFESKVSIFVAENWRRVGFESEQPLTESITSWIFLNECPTFLIFRDG